LAELNNKTINDTLRGDGYLYNGDLYVCTGFSGTQALFTNVGKIQGPAGNPGNAPIFKVENDALYASTNNGTT
jgi:hypothetical protein